MKKIIFVLSLFSFIGCSEPVLEPNEYIVIDTIDINKNGFGKVLTYDVVVKYHDDTTFHFGELNTHGDLISIKFKKIKNYYK